MRIDPEGIYLELLPGSTTINLKTQKTKQVAAVRLHWKHDPRPGTKWTTRAYVADSLGEILHGIASLIDNIGLEKFLETKEITRD